MFSEKKMHIHLEIKEQLETDNVTLITLVYFLKLQNRRRRRIRIMSQTAKTHGVVFFLCRAILV